MSSAEQEVQQVLAHIGQGADECKQLCEDGCNAFAVIDKDGNGVLTKNELKEVYKRLGKTDQDAENAWGLCDADRDGKVTRLEFIKGLVCVGIEHSLRNVFNQFDKDGSGAIDTDELAAVHKECHNQGINAHDLEKYVKEHDTDGSGKLEFNEFKKALFGVD